MGGGGGVEAHARMLLSREGGFSSCVTSRYIGGEG